MTKSMEHRKSIAPDEFSGRFDNAARRILRIESLPEYNVPADRVIFDLFAQGVPLPDLNPSGAMMEWFKKIEAFRAKGIAFERLRLIPDQIATYLRYEIEWCYTNSWAYGEEIRFKPLTAVEPALRTDLYAIDDTDVFYIEYAEDGSWRGFSVEQNSDHAQFLIIASSDQWRNAAKLEDFLSTYRRNSL